MHTVSTDINQLAMPAQLAGMESVLTIGAFDGIHIGHQALIQRLVNRAKRIKPIARKNTVAGLITFSPHPSVVLYPDKPFSYLTTPTEKKSLLERPSIRIQTPTICPFGIFQNGPFGQRSLECKAIRYLQRQICYNGCASSAKRFEKKKTS